MYWIWSQWVKSRMVWFGKVELEVLVVMSNESLTQDDNNGNGKYNQCDFAYLWDWKGLGVRGEARKTRLWGGKGRGKRRSHLEQVGFEIIAANCKNRPVQRWRFCDLLFCFALTFKSVISTSSELLTWTLYLGFMLYFCISFFK